MGGSGIPCDLTSMTNVRVGFPVCSAFYLLLGQSNGFYAPYMLDQKLEVLLEEFFITDSISCLRLIKIISFGVSFGSWCDSSDLPFH